MIPYLILVITIILLQLSFRKKKNTKFNYCLAFILLFLFAALRGNGSGDYFTYLKNSKMIMSIESVLNFNFPMEIGFRLIAYINNSLGLHEQMVVVVMNLISLLCVYKFIEKYSPDKMLSILLFLPLYFQFDMHAARAAVAIGISTLGFKYLYENKLLKYIGIIFLASCFHKSVWILLPIYFFRNIKINKYIGLGTIVFTAFLSYFFSMEKIILKILQLIPFINPLINKFENYMQSEIYGYSYKIYDPRIFLIVSIYIVAIFILNRENRFENLLINYVWLNVIFMFIFRENTFFITRLAAYLNIYTIIIIPVILSKYKNSIARKKYYLYRLGIIYIYIAYVFKFVFYNVDYKLFFMNL